MRINLFIITDPSSIFSTQTYTSFLIWNKIIFVTACIIFSSKEKTAYPMDWVFVLQQFFFFTQNCHHFAFAQESHLFWLAAVTALFEHLQPLHPALLGHWKPALFVTRDLSVISLPLPLASICTWLTLQESLPFPDLFLQQGFPCEKTRAKLIAKMIKNVVFFNIFPLPVQLSDYNLQLLVIIITELFCSKIYIY